MRLSFVMPLYIVIMVIKSQRNSVNIATRTKMAPYLKKAYRVTRNKPFCHFHINLPQLFQAT